jgi:hypothetical protein
MKTAFPFVTAVTALVTFSACKKSGPDTPAAPAPAATLEQKVAEGPEAAAREAVKIQEELAAVMETITDAASAEQAVAKLGPIAEKFAIVAKAANGMDQKMSAEQDAELKELLKPSQARLTAAMERAMPIIAQNPEIGRKMQEAMSKMAP